MCSTNYKIQSEKYPHFYLRTIHKNDNEKLMLWKNSNNKSFFFHEMIEEEQQKKWFQAYLKRENDVMFMVEEVFYGSVGCMGYRMLEDGICDIYNIIRGCASLSNTRMSEAMELMLSYIFMEKEIQIVKCDVLKDNAAILWYEKCGFLKKEEKKNYFILELMRKNFSICSFNKENTK